MADKNWLQLITSRRQSGPVRPPDDAAPRLAKLKGIRAVVFDVYGTLFSSGVGDISLATEENRDDALRAVLHDNGIKLLNTSTDDRRLDEQLHAIIHRHQDLRRQEGIEYPEVDIRSVWADFIQELDAGELTDHDSDFNVESLVIDYETRVNPTQPMPGLAETLSALRAFGPMSIISNAQFYTPLLFEAFLNASIHALGFCPKCNVWSYEELEGKPSQKLYEIAAERLKKHHNLTPEQCLYIGNDMRNDIWPAQALGFRTALFAGDRLSLRRRSDHPECGKLQADAEITELGQISDLLF